MTIITALKTKSLQLRKERNPIASSIQFAISEIEKIGKNSGNRITTEDEAIKVVQKLIATVDENIAFAIKENDNGRQIHLNHEKQILQSVLPKMVSESEVRSAMLLEFNDKPISNKGEVMKWAKTKWGALVDMKQVNTIAQELLGV